jgi:hypothetical protein
MPTSRFVTAAKGAKRRSLHSSSRDSLRNEDRRMVMSNKKNIADLVEEAVDQGATTVEEIHKAIADLPLRILEEIDLLKKPVGEIRKVQDHSIRAVYDLIREINERVGDLASDVLSRRRSSARA